MTDRARATLGRWSLPVIAMACAIALIAGRRDGQAAPPVTAAVVDDEGRFVNADPMRGRLLVLNHGCADCHGGGSNPVAPGYLSGLRDTLQQFRIGPFITRPRNLTPDNVTGLGRFTERQIFNAIRYGLRPGETPDVDITSNVPGKGNFPANPKYLAIPMPWPAFRHMPDQEIQDIAAYLKRSVKPVANKVQDSDGPPDFWASEYTVEKIGSYPAVAFPAPSEH